MKKHCSLIISGQLLAYYFLLFTSNVSSQSPVNSAMFGTMKTRQLGPGTMSGRITSLDGVVQDEGKTIYVGCAGGGCQSDVAIRGNCCRTGNSGIHQRCDGVVNDIAPRAGQFTCYRKRKTKK